jgi:hypothetical protein
MKPVIMIDDPIMVTGRDVGPGLILSNDIQLSVAAWINVWLNEQQQ